jgi:hypothetical protein
MLAALGACSGGPDDPCAGDAPGMRFVIHLEAPEAAPPGELGVTYANGVVERFDQALGADWPDPLIVCVPYGPDAVDGPASASFSARPEDTEIATATFVVDLARRVEIELTFRNATSDAGP